MIFAAAIAALTAPAFAQNNGDIVLTNPQFAGGFRNRGQCQAALAKVRNDQRKNPATRGAGFRAVPRQEEDIQPLIPAHFCEEFPANAGVQPRGSAAKPRRWRRTSSASPAASPAEQAPILG